MLSTTNVARRSELLCASLALFTVSLYLSFKAVRTALSPGVTVKTAEGIEERERLYQEFQHRKNLSHVNVIRCIRFEDSSTENRAKLFLEHSTTFSLRDLLKCNGASLREDAARGHVIQILSGLNYLHDKGLIHRDIQPNNILVVGDILKLTNFGMARNQSSVDNARIQGTCPYMAPEATLQSCCAASDVWSVGITLLELLTGNAPTLDTLNARGFNFVQELRRGGDHPCLPSDVSDQCTAFLKICLAIDPRSRMTCARLLRHAWLTGEGNREIG